MGRVFQAEERTGTKVSVTKSVTAMRKSGSRAKAGKGGREGHVKGIYSVGHGEPINVVESGRVVPSDLRRTY